MIAFVKTATRIGMITFEVFWYVANVQRCDQEWKKLGEFPSYSFITFATTFIPSMLCYGAYMIHPPVLHHHLFSVKENVATYSCLITFGSLAG